MDQHGGNGQKGVVNKKKLTVRLTGSLSAVGKAPGKMILQGVGHGKEGVTIRTGEIDLLNRNGKTIVNRPTSSPSKWKISEAEKKKTTVGYRGRGEWGDRGGEDAQGVAKAGLERRSGGREGPSNRGHYWRGPEVVRAKTRANRGTT